MGKLLEKHQLGKTILQGREQGLLESRETKDSIQHEGERSQKEAVHGGEMSKQSAGERDGESNEDKLETRIMKLDDRMYDRLTAAAEPSTWNRGIPWKYEDEGDEWQRWEGSWWIRVNQDDLKILVKGEKDTKGIEEDD